MTTAMIILAMMIMAIPITHPQHHLRWQSRLPWLPQRPRLLELRRLCLR